MPNVLLSICLIIILLYVYLQIKLYKNQRFIQNVVISKDFKERLSTYSGYIICAEGYSILFELKLLNTLYKIVRKGHPCFVINVNKSLDDEQIDLDFVEELKVTNVPCILLLEQGKKIKELKFEGLSDSQIIINTSKLVR